MSFYVLVIQRFFLNSATIRETCAMNRAAFMKGGSDIAHLRLRSENDPRTGQGLIYKQDADISSVSAN